MLIWAYPTSSFFFSTHLCHFSSWLTNALRDLSNLAFFYSFLSVFLLTLLNVIPNTCVKRPYSDSQPITSWHSCYTLRFIIHETAVSVWGLCCLQVMLEISYLCDAHMTGMTMWDLEVGKYHFSSREYKYIKHSWIIFI